jgi:hypothetical protein
VRGERIGHTNSRNVVKIDAPIDAFKPAEWRQSGCVKKTTRAHSADIDKHHTICAPTSRRSVSLARTAAIQRQAIDAGASRPPSSTIRYEYTPPRAHYTVVSAVSSRPAFLHTMWQRHGDVSVSVQFLLLLLLLLNCTDAATSSPKTGSVVLEVNGCSFGSYASVPRLVSASESRGRFLHRFWTNAGLGHSMTVLNVALRYALANNLTLLFDHDLMNLAHAPPPPPSPEDFFQFGFGEQSYQAWRANSSNSNVRVLRWPNKKFPAVPFQTAENGKSFATFARHHRKSRVLFQLPIKDLNRFPDQVTLAAQHERKRGTAMMFVELIISCRNDTCEHTY